MRIAPPVGAEATSSVLFFGCSFTFGEGLQDNQTLPHQVGVRSDGRYQTYNFAFHGYGPQQMLASLEGGRVHQVVSIPPRFAIYQALPDHVARVAGKTPYGQHGPRYEIDADGSLRRHGHFDDGQEPPSGWKAHLEGQFHKSATYRVLSSLQPATTNDDIHLLLAIVRKSRDLLVAENPGIELHVILWRNFEYEEDTYRKLQAGFREMNVPIHLVENILPDYNNNPEKYWLNADNRHPNALADRLIANYVVAQILSRSSALQPTP